MKEPWKVVQWVQAGKPYEGLGVVHNISIWNILFILFLCCVPYTMAINLFRPLDHFTLYWFHKRTDLIQQMFCHLVAFVVSQLLNHRSPECSGHVLRHLCLQGPVCSCYNCTMKTEKYSKQLRIVFIEYSGDGYKNNQCQRTSPGVQLNPSLQNLRNMHV